MPDAAPDWSAAGQGPRREVPVLSVDGFEGPLDFLLEMVRRQRVDIGRLAILPLIEQFVAALSVARVPIERQAEWVVMASWLVQLRAQLLLPASPAEAAEADAQANRRLAQLEELAFIRAAAAWLNERQQLGIDVFARGAPEVPIQQRGVLIVAYLEAVLAMLEGPAARPAEAAPPYRPAPPDLWRVPDALQRIRGLLDARGEGAEMGRLLPDIPDGPQHALKRRSGVASTFVASLELARDGAVRLDQAEPFGAILLHRTSGSGSYDTARPATGVDGA